METDENAVPASMAAQAFDVERFCRRALREGLNGRLGLQYVSHDCSHVELLLPGLRTPTQVASWSLQGDGLIMTLLDMAGTLSVWAAAGKFRPHATLDLRVDHLHCPQDGEPVHGRASCYFLDAKVASVRGMARTASGQDLASFAATYIFTD